MIDTFQMYSKPDNETRQEINKYFKPYKSEKGFVRTLKPVKGISLKYKIKHNQILIVVNPASVLGKSQIVNDDYEIVKEVIDRNLSNYFRRLRFSDFTLSRIDYKLDIVTLYKDVYLDILKQFRDYYRGKFRQDYMTSVYYKGTSYVFNLYDKEVKERLNS